MPKKNFSLSEAFQWYKKAAEKNFPIACHRLGEMCASGAGVAKNEEQAIKWYKQAAENDYIPSQKVLAEAYEKGLLGLPSDSASAMYWLQRSQSSRKV